MSEPSAPAGARSVAHNTAALLMARGAGLLVSFAFGVYVVRSLGVEEFGRFSVLTATYTLLTIAVHLGLASLLVREVSRAPAEAGRYLRASLRLKLTAGLACLVALVIGPALLPPGRPLAAALALVGVALVLDGFSESISIFFQARRRFAVPSALGLAGGALYAAFGATAVLLGGRSTELIASMVAAKLVQAGLSWWLLQRARGEVDLRGAIDWAFCGRLLRAAAPFFFSKLFYLIYFRIDMLMLDALAGERSVGLYGAAYKFVNLASTAAAAFTAALFPVMSAAARRPGDAFAEMFRHSLRYLLVLGVGIAGLCAFLAEDLLRVLFTARYEPAAPALQVLAWAVVPVFANLVLSNAMLSLDLERWAVPIGAVAVAVNVGLNLVWIPRYRELGAAAATLAAEAAVLAAYAGLLLHRRPLRLPASTVAGLIGAGAALGLAAAGLGAAVWPLTAAGAGAAYAAALWAFRVLRPADLENGRRLLLSGRGRA